ncbi:hypothetical protein ACN2C6_19465 (plasmid) [Caulobacter sp. ErkDOM-YI]|uniref:hypothetical protein n=1 Tax=unclassified Caulobacter TaxID=2648921 RepID=UPI003AF50456
MKSYLNRAALTALALALVANVTPAAAQFSGLKAMKSVGAPSSGGDIDGFLATTQRAEALTRVSAISLLQAVSSREEADRLRSTMAAAEAQSDPKEREIALRRVASDAAAQLAAIDYDAKSKELERTATTEQRKQMAVAVYNLALGIMLDKSAVEQGHALTQSAMGNPMGMATQGAKLLRVKDAASSISGQMGNLAKILTGLPKLMSVAKLTALPTSTADLPKSAVD